MSVISHCECITDEEVKLYTTTRYVISGISKEKGGVQVREMMESSGRAAREPTAARRPVIRGLT